MKETASLTISSSLHGIIISLINMYVLFYVLVEVEIYTDCSKITIGIYIGPYSEVIIEEVKDLKVIVLIEIALMGVENLKIIVLTKNICLNKLLNKATTIILKVKFKNLFIRVNYSKKFKYFNIWVKLRLKKVKILFIILVKLVEISIKKSYILFKIALKLAFIYLNLLLLFIIRMLFYV